MNDVLKEHYQKKYKREIIVIRNSVLIDKGEVLKVKSELSSFKIIYTGAIYWAQIGAIKNLIKAVKEIKDFKVTLHLYTPHDKNYLARRKIFQTDKIIFNKGTPSEMKKIQRSANILFVPLSFNTNYSFLINSSSPGKTYEYMASGKPILIHAPRDSYISKYAKKHEFALVVDDDDADKLKVAINRLATDKKLVEEITDNAQKILFLNHDAMKSSRFFQTFFIKK